MTDLIELAAVLEQPIQRSYRFAAAVLAEGRYDSVDQAGQTRTDNHQPDRRGEEHVPAIALTGLLKMLPALLDHRRSFRAKPLTLPFAPPACPDDRFPLGASLAQTDRLFHFRTAWNPALRLPVSSATLDTKGRRMRLRVLAFALAGLISAVPGEAETGTSIEAGAFTSTIRFSAEGPLQVRQRGFFFPIVEYTDDRGVRQQRKGIIASRMIAPGTFVGIGLFETTPKSRGYWGDVPPNVAPRRSKRAASIGFNWQF